MTGPLSKGSLPHEIDCLEDKIVREQGRQTHDDLSFTSVRLEPWQVEFARFIKAHLNTKLGNVYRCSVHHGEKILREEIGESSPHDYIKETERMWVMATTRLRKNASCPKKIREMTRDLQSLEHEVTLDIDDEKTDDPITVSYNESIGSSIHDSWEMMANESKSGALRMLIGIGLGYSKFSDDFYVGYGDECLNNSVKLFRTVRELLEMHIADYVSSAVVEWEMNGYDEQVSKVLHEIFGMMTTKYSEQVRTAMELVDMYNGKNPKLSSNYEV